MMFRYLAIVGLTVALTGCYKNTDDVAKQPSVPAAEQTSSQEAQKLASTIYFDFDKAVLSDSAKKILTAHAESLKLNPAKKIIVQGHTDIKGTKDYNLGLGERRAHSVSAYLLTQGVQPNQIKEVSFGKEQVLSQADNEVAQSKNRRAELVYNPN